MLADISSVDAIYIICGLSSCKVYRCAACQFKHALSGFLPKRREALAGSPA